MMTGLHAFACISAKLAVPKAWFFIAVNDDEFIVQNM